MKCLLSFLICLSSQAAIVPFFNGGGYTREEQVNPSWFVLNNGTPSKLYLNGVYQSQETGTNDLNMTAAWARHNVGCKVGVLHDGAHGDRVTDCVRQISPFSPIYNREMPRWYADTIAEGILQCATNGCGVIVVAGGFGEDSTNLWAVLNSFPDVVFIWSAPDREGNMDTTLLQYPYAWNLPNVLYVSASDRNGNHYNPSAVGTNCIAAPGRNIVALTGGTLTYSSGSSYSGGEVAGVAALVRHQFPGMAAAQVVTKLKVAATGSVRLVNPVNALRPLPVTQVIPIPEAMNQ